MNKYHFFLLTLLCFNVHRLTPAETEPATQKEIDKAYGEIVELKLEHKNDPSLYFYNLLKSFINCSSEIKKGAYAKIIQNKKTQIIKLLITSGCRPAFDMLSQEDIDNFNSIDVQQSKDTRLLNATLEQNLEDVEQALKDGANPNAQTLRDGPKYFLDALDTPLIRALKPYWLQAIRHLNDPEPEAQELIDQQLKTKNTIYNILKKLLDHGADPNIANKRKRPALFFACNFASDTNFCRLLLEHGANPNAKDQDGNTILHELLIPHTTKEEETIKLLLYHGVSISKGLHSGELNLIKEFQKELETELETERIEKETNDQSLITYLHAPQNPHEASTKIRNNVNEVIKKLLQPESKYE